MKTAPNAPPPRAPPMLPLACRFAIQPCLLAIAAWLHGPPSRKPHPGRAVVKRNVQRASERPIRAAYLPYPPPAAHSACMHLPVRIVGALLLVAFAAVTAAGCAG